MSKKEKLTALKIDNSMKKTLQFMKSENDYL